jgi:hypothetical protein
MSVRVTFAGSVAPDVASAIRPVIAKWLWILPSWCHELHVKDAPDDRDAVLSIGLQHEYRRATLYAGVVWLGESKDDRERAVVHELTHVILAPMSDFSDDLVNKTCRDNDTLRGWANEQNRRAVESVVVDLTETLLAKRRTKRK